MNNNAINRDANIQTFNVESEKYMKSRPKYPDRLYKEIIKHCNDLNCAWDCGCGNGQVSVDLIGIFKTVEASDINENQVSHASKNSRIKYTIQSSESTNYKNNSFDLVCAAQCLHWFDLDSYFAEVKRVLKTSGIFACWGYSFFSIEEEIDTLIDKNLLEIINPFWSEKSRLLHNGYRDIVFPFKEILIPKIEMTISWNLQELIDYLSTWSAVKLYDKKMNVSVLDELKIILEKKWIMNDKKCIKMEFYYYIGKNETV
jgi:ubiquinone/menaquinone biosynthesis C-methylase UbiE